MLANPDVNRDAQFPGQSILQLFDIVSVTTLKFGDRKRTKRLRMSPNPELEHFLNLLATKCHGLRALKLYDPELSDPRLKNSLMEIIRVNASSLMTLLIQRIALNRDDLPIICLCNRLERLVIYKAPHNSDFMASAVENFPNLLTVHIGERHPSAPYGIPSILGALSIFCQRLEKLTIVKWQLNPFSHTEPTTSLALLLSRCRALSELAIWYNSAANDSLFHFLTIAAPNLRVIQINYCKDLTTDPVVDPIRLASLVHLRDWLCPHDTDRRADEIHWPKLTSLDLDNSPLVSLNLVPRLMKGCPKLERLVLPRHLNGVSKVQAELTTNDFEIVYEAEKEAWTLKGRREPITQCFSSRNWSRQM
ncbi:hypothetical protein BC937DRAFT_90366 [Endogone sp. FLAS-F59071]|nr:hypothetical protein BC937DRAFT_90366 [Endogone sp. FLAS-F59071]|eukprot:RUS17148.1 hypothetical protein BC937DRAFT_90366 [Endogone sp. FLAS-F59071]